MTHQQYFAGVGRRKTSIARVRLFPGTGEILVTRVRHVKGTSDPVTEKRALDTYFGSPLWTAQVQEPFQAIGQVGRYNVEVRVTGGGPSGQAGAIRHAIARALVASDENLKAPLRQQGLLTRDARMKERKKYGLKRARKAPQYTKR
jgi:small subunit ribosomal protein S9